MRPRASIGGMAVTALAAMAVWAGSQDPAPTFPHEKHASVFPVCEGCHAGILSGVADSAFPTYDDCTRCHDGTREHAVAWRAPRQHTSNVRFSHPSHFAATDNAGDSTTCLTCHALTDPPRRMAVSGPDPDRCILCHAHRSESHIAPTAACRQCHLPITSVPTIPVGRIAGFPRPAWHDAGDFSSQHGLVKATQAASCAVCHARETCERCHANADRVQLITGLARDARIAALQVGKPAVYESPTSHVGSGWRDVHGDSALRSIQSCASCHTQTSCDACHAGGSGSSRRQIAALPGGSVTAGLGVPASRINRAVHPADIASRHGTLASAGVQSCAQCHSEQTCAGCHAASDSRRFHADNFVERHAVEVFGAASDCQSCHNPERFCRDCHSSSGIAAGGRMRAAFHTGKANWVLSHGQAARTGMESCAACHRQNDCVRCHSAAGGWGVNPHRSGFQANAIGARNSASCRWCHIGPLPGGER